MRFRRIYWVTEQVDEQGMSEVTGIFTSIPDLVDTGLGIRDVCAKRAGFRISLCELDSNQSPILSVGSPEFGGLDDGIEPVVQSGEVSVAELASLKDALRAHRESLT